MIYPEATESTVAKTINHKLISKKVLLKLVSIEKIKAAERSWATTRTTRLCTRTKESKLIVLKNTPY